MEFATSLSAGRPQPRIAFISGTARTFAGSRAPLIRALVARGCPVLAVAPAFSPEQESSLAFIGAETATFELQPKGLSLLADWQLTRNLVDIIAKWKPDAIVAMGERIMALGLLAARRARVPRRIALANGFAARGTPFDATPDPMRTAPRVLFRGLKTATAAVFHNRDDRRRLERMGALPPGLDVRVLPGAGVALDTFDALPLPAIGAAPVFLMIATLDEARGVLDYCEAARRLKSLAPSAEVLLAGPAGDSPAGLRPETLRPYADVVTFLGPLSDVRSALARCHVFVYPSRTEGMPRAVLEAMASARGVVTTRVGGCRDTVDDCVNGCLVPPGDSQALCEAMWGLVLRPELLPVMAAASRAKAERKFAEKPVIAAWLDLLAVATPTPAERQAALV